MDTPSAPTRPRFASGDAVRMSPRLIAELIANGCRAHADEFGGCVGVVQGPTDYGTQLGPEVDVRWRPSRLRYAYGPDDLEPAGRDDFGWEPAGGEVPPGPLGLLETAEVLLWHDGPLTYTFFDVGGREMLAHMLGWTPAALRFAAVAIAPGRLAALKAYALPIRDALDCPELWVVDVERGVPVRAWLTPFASLPEGVLPREGVPLRTRNADIAEG